MTTVKLIEYAEAPPEVRAVYDDIMATRKIDWVNNFWKALAHHPPTLQPDLGEHQAGHGAGRPRPSHQGDALPRGERGPHL